MTSPFPRLQYLVAWANGPLDDPGLIGTVAAPGTLGGPGVWSDITGWVLGHQISRGRQHELDAFEAGTLTVNLDNSAGTFNPWNSAGPFYGHLVPAKPVQVRVTVGDAVFYRFTGLISALPILWPDPRSAQATITASDTFRWWNTAGIGTAGLPEELAGARIGHLLDAVGWPAGARNVDEGATVIQADTQNLVATAALGLLQSVETTEAGAFFMDGAGRATFIERGALTFDPTNPTSPYTTTQATIGDAADAGELPFQPGPTLGVDDLDIYNQGAVTRLGGVEQVYNDAASQAEYGVHTWKPSGTVLYTSDAEALNRAIYVVAAHAQPVVRVAAVAVNLADLIAPGLTGRLLALDLMHRITLNRHGIPGEGDPFSHDGNIEHLTETVTADTWLVTFALAPADTAGYWVWDVSAWGDGPNPTRWN